MLVFLPKDLILTTALSKEPLRQGVMITLPDKVTTSCVVQSDTWEAHGMHEWIHISRKRTVPLLVLISMATFVSHPLYGVLAVV